MRTNIYNADGKIAQRLAQLLDTLSLQVAKPLVEGADYLYRESVLIQSSDTQTWLLHCPVQSAMLLTYRPSPGCPGTAKPGPYHWNPKTSFLNLLLEKETTFQLAPAKEIPLSILL